MLKIFAVLCLLLTAGCQPGGTYTSESEYKEKYEGDKEVGLKTSSHASWKGEWKS